MIPNALRSFHLPAEGSSMFASGNLQVQGLFSKLFGSTPVPTVVRTQRRGDKIKWLRSFQGSTFGSSEWVYSNDKRHARGQPVAAFGLGYSAWKNPDGTPSSKFQDMHDIESVFGVDFHFCWEVASDKTVLPHHTHTTIWGLVLPRELVSVELSMKPHADDGGWDLSMTASVMHGAVLLIGYEGSMRLVDEIKYVQGFHDLVLFDGHCSLCNASVDFLMLFDTFQRFVFCSQQHPAALAALKTTHPHAISIVGSVGSETDQDSVLVLGADGKLYHHSDAALRALQVIGGPLGWAAALAKLLPRQWRDAVYNLVGRNRYGWFGRKGTCRLPTPAERMRFL